MPVQKRFQVDEKTVLRFAEEKDVAVVLEFVRALAEYEHLQDQVQATVEDIRQYVFRDQRAEVVICEYEGVPAGFVLFFYTFSTFLGKPGIYIEDMFVKPECRGKGLGKLLLSFIITLAKERHCGRVEWSCLNWNESAFKFYRSQGATAMSDWGLFRIFVDYLW
jgi:GNAT superfamily N-acetyltransferase